METSPPTIIARLARASVGLLAVLAMDVHAHPAASGGSLRGLTWPLSVDIVLALGLAAVLYARGCRQLQDKTALASPGRQGAFYAGLAAVFLALQTPLDVASEHVFSLHQIQHLLLRGVAPMLLMLAVPGGPLLAGLPAALRRAVARSIVSHPLVRGAFRGATRPVDCTAAYAGTLYFWQLPRFHEAALTNSALHYGMHVTMLLSGLLFFWVLFDPRPAPWGARFSSRLAMTGAAIFVNIPLGAVIALKREILYPAYDRVGRWFDVAPLQDELLGGLVIWIASSMMGLIAVLLVLRLWGLADAKADRQRSSASAIHAAAASSTAADLSKRKSARRRFGWELALIPLVVFAAVILSAVFLAHSDRNLPGALPQAHSIESGLGRGPGGRPGRSALARTALTSAEHAAAPKAEATP